MMRACSSLILGAVAESKMSTILVKSGTKREGKEKEKDRK